MPQKHSKNNTDAAVFTYHERREAGYGTTKQRIGTDSQLPFGYCCLTLKPVVDPVVRSVRACVCVWEGRGGGGGGWMGAWARGLAGWLAGAGCVSDPINPIHHLLLRSGGLATHTHTLTQHNHPTQHNPPPRRSPSSPSGHLYSREAIVEYLLTKTQELKKQKALWEVRAWVGEVVGARVEGLGEGACVEGMCMCWNLHASLCT
jgi:hypothetical protein